MKRQLGVIDLFAGAGGLSEGLRQAGFICIGASEVDETYSDTYGSNHPGVTVYKGDIRRLSVSRVLADTGLAVGELDLLAGGPPCQGFSINAPTRSMNDSRNHLFLEFLRFVIGLQPKVVLIENVPGLISTEGGHVVKAIYNALGNAGYNLHHMILYAAHYGVPQMRWRTVFLGSRADVKLPRFPEPTHYANGRANFTHSRTLCFKLLPLLASNLLSQVTVSQAISDLPPLLNGEGQNMTDYTLQPLTRYQESMRQGAARLWNHKAPKVHQINVTRMQYVKPGGSWRDLPFELLPKGLKRAQRSDHTRRYGRLDPSGLSTTIMTKCDPHWGSFFHYEQDRVITPREAARLQSFPDRYVFTGSLIKQYQQVGNAVPPLLAKAIGREIMAVLEG